MAASERLYLQKAKRYPTQATKITSGWIRKGVDKLISTTGSRTRMNIVGAIELNNLSAAVFDQFKAVNGQAIIDFFKKVRSACASKSVIHMVLDGAGYHRSQEVAAEAEKLDIKLHYLPAYSPNLNPIERLWKVINGFILRGVSGSLMKNTRRSCVRSKRSRVTLKCLGDEFEVVQGYLDGVGA